MNDTPIQIHFEIQKEDLNCCICYLPVTTPLIHCSNAYHFVCLNCMKKSNVKCPLCQSARLHHDAVLEKQLKSQLVKCPNEGCKALIFEWGVEEHAEECQFSKKDCPVCNEKVTIHSINKHFKSGCKILFMEHSLRDGDSVSPALQSYCRRKSDGYKLELENIKSSFVIIHHQVSTLFTRTAHGWVVSVFSMKDDEKEVDVRYWLAKESEGYDLTYKLSVKVTNTFTEAVGLPIIPLEAIELGIATTMW